MVHEVAAVPLVCVSHQYICQGFVDLESHTNTITLRFQAERPPEGGAPISIEVERR